MEPPPLHAAMRRQRRVVSLETPGDFAPGRRGFFWGKTWGFHGDFMVISWDIEYI
jgi:hypothetical protein